MNSIFRLEHTDRPGIHLIDVAEKLTTFIERFRGFVSQSNRFIYLSLDEHSNCLIANSLSTCVHHMMGLISNLNQSKKRIPLTLAELIEIENKRRLSQ